MPQKIIDFITDKRFVRRTRELKTLTVMLRLYCRAHKHQEQQGLCPRCIRLLDYAARRLEACIFGDAKPTCTNCLVHCYSQNLREEMRTVMRWAGPRMLLRHPILGIQHLWNGRRPSPRLPEKAQKHRKTP